LSFFAVLIWAATSQAALVVTFQGGNHWNGTIVSTHTNLASGSPTDNQTDAGGVNSPGNWGNNPVVTSGSLAGVADADEFKMTVLGYTTSNLSGVDLTVTNQNNVTKNATNGWGVLNTDIENDDALTFTFDLSGLPANTGLRITDVAGRNTGGSGQEIQIVVDGVSVTDLGGLSGSGLSIDIADGDLVAFREIGVSTGDYRLKTFTLETVAAIPEPSTLLLAALGLLGLLCGR
jgi:hypothetical protein